MILEISSFEDSLISLSFLLEILIQLSTKGSSFSRIRFFSFSSSKYSNEDTGLFISFDRM